MYLKNGDVHVFFVRRKGQIGLRDDLIARLDAELSASLCPVMRDAASLTSFEVQSLQLEIFIYRNAKVKGKIQKYLLDVKSSGSIGKTVLATGAL